MVYCKKKKKSRPEGRNSYPVQCKYKYFNLKTQEPRENCPALYLRRITPGKYYIFVETRRVPAMRTVMFRHFFCLYGNTSGSRHMSRHHINGPNGRQATPVACMKGKPVDYNK